MVSTMGLRDIQASIGSTSDDSFVRSAIMCAPDRTTSIDIIDADGSLLARLNIRGHDSHKSIDIISDEQYAVEVQRLGRPVVRRTAVPDAPNAVVMVLFD